MVERPAIHDTLGRMARISGTLTLMTADPLTGAADLSGHFLPAAPRSSRATLARWRSEHAQTDVGRALIDALEATARELDAAAPHPISIHWVIDDGVARLVETVPQALGPAAHVRAIVERVASGRLLRDAALFAVLPDQLEAAGVLSLAADSTTLVARGLAASPGAAVGPLAFHPSEVRAGSIWVVDDLAAEDAPLLTTAAGVVATTGGLTSDAAIMARALRKPCVVSTPIRSEDHAAGGVVSLDGGTGELHRGALSVRWRASHAHAETFLSWAIDEAGGDGTPREILTRLHARSPRQGGASD
jgi:pyruvate,orthophosphate dikinase